ncbi:hypothetical protein GCM10017566_67380 [Amycolatopsis bartoniae]|uniref:Uncharacterized protein n=1 Tax=Amycolatopsis bartoniae TaxID=941986 RepID=A0A8H9J1C0_9PSEU|nr:hypothetical protein GCM10017566_67380 [Amycolatopsis bartoniae]
MPGCHSALDEVDARLLSSGLAVPEAGLVPTVAQAAERSATGRRRRRTSETGGGV